jgi:hypothetical protein
MMRFLLICTAILWAKFIFGLRGDHTNEVHFDEIQIICLFGGMVCLFVATMLKNYEDEPEAMRAWFLYRLIRGWPALVAIIVAVIGTILKMQN